MERDLRVLVTKCPEVKGNYAGANSLVTHLIRMEKDTAWYWTTEEIRRLAEETPYEAIFFAIDNLKLFANIIAGETKVGKELYQNFLAAHCRPRPRVKGVRCV